MRSLQGNILFGQNLTIKIQQCSRSLQCSSSVKCLIMLIVNRRSPEGEKETSRSGGTQPKKGGEDGELEDKVPVIMILLVPKASEASDGDFLFLQEF